MYFTINISYSFFHFYIHFYFRFYFYLQILRAKEVCIPEEYSFCSSVDSDSNVNSLSSEDDIDSKEVDLRAGNEMSVSYDRNHRNDDNYNNDNSDDNDNNNERKLLIDHSVNKCKEDFRNDNDVWKKKKKEKDNGKRKVTEKEEEEKVLKKEKAMSGKQQINQKKSAGLWMKNQKNGVKLE